MSVTVKDVEHIAKLARLEFTGPEKQEFTHQLNEILAYVEQLNKLET
ncbi:MAG: Asp-tRNA(Asn)/Glu-tRNA(Gln) amidotransferase subunit GatC, partial [Bacteroidota bacterium]